MITLVTGGTGFVGWYVVQRLLAAGYSLRLLAQPEQPIVSEWRERVDVIRGDLTDLHKLPGLLSGVSTVVHLAGEVRQAERFTSVNVQGTQQLLAACAAAGNLRVVHLSSVGVIGAKRPGVYTEDSVCHPRNAYEFSKFQGEQIAREHIRNNTLRMTVLRPTIVFGAHTRGSADSFLSWLRSINSGRFRFVGSGTGAANYVYVDDVAATVAAVLERDETIGEVYHVADPTTIGDLVAQIVQDLHVNPPGRLPTPIGYAAALTFEGVGRVLRRAMPLTVARVRALTSHTIYSGDKLQASLSFPVGWRVGVTQTIEDYRRVGLL